MTRTTQVNIRLTKKEKQILTKAAQDKGHGSLSEFMRVEAIKAAENLIAARKLEDSRRSCGYCWYGKKGNP